MSGGAPKGNKNHFKHGLSHTRIDNIYRSMISRCYNKQNTRYANYGGRGIAVCEEWLKNKNAFFDWAKNNGYSDDLTIDRIDANGNYEPNNCRWVSYTIQNNNRTNNRILVVNGVSHNLSEWSKITGIKVSTIHQRLKVGWSVEDAVLKAVKL